VSEKFPKSVYEKTLLKLQAELVNLQEWTKVEGKRIVVIFEGVTRLERAQLSNDLPNILILGSHRSLRFRLRPSGKSASGTSNGM